MTRGHPALLSVILAIPFVGGGAYLYAFHQDFTTLGIVVPPAELRLVGLLLASFGLVIVIIGAYVQLVGPAPPSIQDDEEVIETRHPSQRVAISQIVLGVPLLGIALYLLFFTRVPYVYPTSSLLAGLYFFSSGLKTYWSNTLTSYYLTTKRVIREYRFISLQRQEIPLNKVRGIEERKSIMEAIVGLGNIRVASGGGGGTVQLVIQNIGRSAEFAGKLRNRTS